MEQDLKEQIASLKLQIGLLKNEVAKWKGAAKFANLDRARMERQEIERIKEVEHNQNSNTWKLKK